MRKNTMKVIVFIAVTAVIATAKASTYLCDKQECTKGEAIVKLAKGQVKEVLKIDRMKLDEEKGTLKIAKKD